MTRRARRQVFPPWRIRSPLDHDPEHARMLAAHAFTRGIAAALRASMPSNDSFIDITEELTGVSGGRTRARAQDQGFGGGVMGWFDNLYHSIVNHFASDIGGKKMAQGLYGKHTTHADEVRSSAAMKKFLAGSHKLPKGVPNIFG